MKDPGQTEFENPYFFIEEERGTFIVYVLQIWSISRCWRKAWNEWWWCEAEEEKSSPSTPKCCTKKPILLTKKKEDFWVFKTIKPKKPQPLPHDFNLSLSISQMVLPDNKDAYHQKVSQYLPDEQKIHFFASFSSTILACKKWALFGCFSPKIRVLAQSFQFLKTKRVCFACHIIMSSQ